MDSCGSIYRVIFEQVADYHMSWKSAYSQLEVHSDFVHYIELFGLGKAERLFKQHLARLRDEFIARKQNVHMHRLDAILHKLLPDLASVADRFVTKCLDDDDDNSYYYCHYFKLFFRLRYQTSAKRILFLAMHVSMSNTLCPPQKNVHLFIFQITLSKINRF